MADSYLEIARRILKAHRRPMSAREMIDAVQRISELPEHLYGGTMHKTLQARISEDIIKYRFKSRFYRVSPGVFFLRELSSKYSEYGNSVGEYHAIRRAKSIRRQRVLCCSLRDLSPEPGWFDRSEAERCIDFLNSGCGVYVQKEEADKNMTLAQVSTLTIFSHGNKILVHGVGRYVDALQGVGGLSIVFHNYITEFDVDLMNNDLIGTKRNSARESARHIVPCIPPVSDVDLMDRIEIIGALFVPPNMLSIVCVLNFESLDVEIKTKKKSLGSISPNWQDNKNIRNGKMNNLSNLILGEIR